MKKFLLFIVLLFIPLWKVNAENTETIYLNLPNYAPADHIYYSSTGGRYLCIDPNLEAPRYLNEKDSYTFDDNITVNGYIAMMIYSKVYYPQDEMSLIQALRRYTLDYNQNTTYYIGNDTPLENDILNNENARKDIYCAGLCGAGKCNKCSESNKGRKFIEESINEKNNPTDTTFKVIDNSLLRTINTSTVTVQVNGIMPANLSCESKSGNCQISEINNNDKTFKITISDYSKDSTSVRVKISGDGIENNNTLLNEVSLNIYSCSAFDGGRSSFDKNIWIYHGVFQRFINLSEAPSKKAETYIYVPISNSCETLIGSIKELAQAGCCQNIDTSKLVKDSPEEDAYLRNCGDLVNLKYDCGAHSCNSDYAAYTNSYIKQVPMNILLENTKTGNGTFDYTILDNKYNTSKVNNYCGIYSSEFDDIYLPATAMSANGEFFVFDVYNGENCNGSECLRQPYIIGKVTGMFLTKTDQWLRDYNQKLQIEDNYYTSWQKEVEELPNKWANYINALNNLKNAVGASGESDAETKAKSLIRDYEAKNDTINAKVLNNLLSNFQQNRSTYQSAEKSALTLKQSFKAAVGDRIAMQRIKIECEKAEEEFYTNKFKYNLEPEITFNYMQKYEGKLDLQKTSIPLSISDDSAKYWPNISSEKIDTSASIKDQSLNSASRDSSVRKTVDEFAPGRIAKGYYTWDEKTHEKIVYNFAVEDCNQDDFNKKCETFNYKNYSITQIDKEKTLYYKPSKYFYNLDKSGDTLSNVNFQTTIYDGKYTDIGYVYNVSLTALEGEYETSFDISKLGHNGDNGTIQPLVNEYLKKSGKSNAFTSTCNYCNEEVAFSRQCEVCDDDDKLTQNFYYRNISLTDINPNDKNNTNWTDIKGQATTKLIEGSGSPYISINIDDKYVALANTKQENEEEIDKEVLADSTNNYIYDDNSGYLEYSFTLTTKDMQIIRQNTNKTTFDYSKMNFCQNGHKNISKDSDANYCFVCNSDGKECESTFVTAFINDKDMLNNTRLKKWKYFYQDTGESEPSWHYGTINTLNYFAKYKDENGNNRYPDKINCINGNCANQMYYQQEIDPNGKYHGSTTYYYWP